MRHLLTQLTLIGVATGMIVSTDASAESSPGAMVTIVVPYGPGGNGDLAARSMAASLKKNKDIPTLVILNRSGAGGIIGSQYVMNAKPDGQTLLLARVGPQVVTPALDPSVTPYKWNSFTFLGLLETDPYACIVAENSPHKTFKDLLAAIKANPGKLSYASSGNMDASVVFAVKMMLNLGLNSEAAIKVPYKSGPETLSAVLGGQVDFACNGLSPYMGSTLGGKTRALVVSTPSRVAQLPDVPTVDEMGMKNLELVSGWSALYGPPGLSKDVINKWAGFLSRMRTDETWIELVKSRGAQPSILDPDETRRFIEAQFQEYRALSDHIKVKH